MRPPRKARTDRRTTYCASTADRDFSGGGVVLNLTVRFAWHFIIFIKKYFLRDAVFLCETPKIPLRNTAISRLIGESHN